VSEVLVMSGTRPGMTQSINSRADVAVDESGAPSSVVVVAPT